MTVRELYALGKNTLQKAPNADPGLEAFFALEGLLGIPREMALAGQREITPEEEQTFRDFLQRRLTGEPLQYILGRWEFYGLPFWVGPGVLIPRPETELLVAVALEALKPRQNPTLLDLCSGSGCIPVAVAKHCPGAKIWGVEQFPQALAYFRRNIALNGTDQVTPVEGDVFRLPREVAGRRYHVITANPPYIAAEELNLLQQEVQAEPRTALDGGADGLRFYRALPKICLPLLEPGGLLALEIGESQGAAVGALVEEAGYQEVAVGQDLGGLDRVVIGKKPGG